MLEKCEVKNYMGIWYSLLTNEPKTIDVKLTGPRIPRKLKKELKKQGAYNRKSYLLKGCKMDFAENNSFDVNISYGEIE